MNNSIVVENSTWQQVQQAINNDLLCLLPIGASCKEHGPHLPLNTDFVQAKWIAEQLALSFDAIVWPVVSYGYYPAFVEYPGSWSINEKTFIECVLDIIESIAKHGSNKIVLLNTGISTIKPLEEVVITSLYANRLKLLNVYSGKRVEAAVNNIQEQKQGGHADEIETSIMLAINSQAVNMHLAEPGLENIVRGPLNPTDPNKSNYSPNGSMGNPTFASIKKGQQMLNAILEDLSIQIKNL